MLAGLPLGFRFAEQPLLLEGFPRGRISEIYGPRSSGRTALVYTVLAASTGQGEHVALIDTANAFDICSAAAAGVVLEKLLWVRCGGNAEHALRAADLLLQAGGFGVVALDLIEVPPNALARIPPTAWFRFRRTIEPTPTVFLVIAEKSLTKSCAAKRVPLERKKPVFAGAAPFKVLKAG